RSRARSTRAPTRSSATSSPSASSACRGSKEAVVHFAFSDDQIAFRDAVRELLDRECTAAHVRAAWTNATGRVPGLWNQLVEMGVVGMLVGEDRGGLGMTMAGLVLILEETGRCAVPEPIVQTGAFGPELVDRAGQVLASGVTLVPWADTAE